MSRKDKKRERGPLTPKRKFDTSPQMMDAFMLNAAAWTEAAGNFEQAVNLGLFGAPHSLITTAKKIIPTRLGGGNDHPDCETDWARLVAESLSNFSVPTTVETLRSQIAKIRAGT